MNKPNIRRPSREPAPSKAHEIPSHLKFLTEACRGGHGPIEVKPRDLANRWRLSLGALQNARSLGTSPIAWVVSAGRPLYRVENILAHEIANAGGALSPWRIAVELAAMPDVPPALVTRIVDRLKN